MSGLTPAEQTRLRRTAAVLGWQTAALVLASVVLVAAVVLAVVTTTQARAGEDRLRSAVRTADDVRDVGALLRHRLELGLEGATLGAVRCVGKDGLVRGKRLRRGEIQHDGREA